MEVCDGLDNDCDGAIDEEVPGVGDACAEGVGQCRREGALQCQPEVGQVVCDAVAGDPQAETCDGLDNDCDGAIDEELPGVGDACTVGAGECSGAGTVVCIPATGEVTCHAVPSDPTDELCDGLDNDCDGTTDEGIPGVGDVCAAGIGECLRPGTVVCAPETGVVACDAVAGEAAGEICDGLDNDCDGAVDEELALVGDACVAGTGQCRREGTVACTPETGEIACDAVAGTPTDEVCDGLDNDCDDATDEELPGVGDDCAAGTGECLRAGALVCAPDAGGVICDAAPGDPQAEVCDGLDNDCDGELDEELPGVGDDCGVGTGECRGAGTVVCIPATGEVTCHAVPSDPTDELCDGLDNDCDGSVDEGIPGVGDGCSAGTGECLQAGTVVCTAETGVVACDAVAGQALDEVCDGLDNDCDGAVDEELAQIGEECTAGTGECLREGNVACTPETGEVACDAVPGAPADEVCDGLDNDCDDAIDEEVLGVGDDCAAGIGQCRRAGALVCLPDAGGVVCDAAAGDPADEVCDGLDNDCDGAVDEELPGVGDDCGVGTGECRQAGTVVCIPAAGEVTCHAVPSDPTDEVCDGLDNDCDGSVDEGIPGVGDVCSAGTGACARPGAVVCTPETGVVACDAVAVQAEEEVCDGLDNDCDGELDEELPGVGEACSAGIGQCRREGTVACTPETGEVACDAAPTAPADEICDGLDNDCDELTDEDVPGVGDECVAGVGQCLRGGTLVCVPEANEVVCDAVPGEPAEEVCDGLDNDCDGAFDESLPGVGDECIAGLGVCQRDGTVVCVPAVAEVLCFAETGTPELEVCDGLDNDCDGDVDEDLPRVGDPCEVGAGECRAPGQYACDPEADRIVCVGEPGQPSPELCDGLDNDCDGTTDEDAIDAGAPCSDGVGACFAEGQIVCEDALLSCDAVPGLPSEEVCNELDDDCDGDVNEDLACEVYASCDDAQAQGWHADGIYRIADRAGVAHDVWCDQTTDGGGWTLVGSTRNETLDDARSGWHAQLTTLNPAAPAAGVWDGLRDLAALHDVRFACRAAAGPALGPMDVDLSFYRVHWYVTMTTGADAQSCLNPGCDWGGHTPPARRNNLTGATRPLGDHWNNRNGDNCFEMEDSCGDIDDFTVDFDDRGIDSNQVDGTDWGEDDRMRKCGTFQNRTLDGQWFIFVR